MRDIFILLFTGLLFPVIAQNTDTLEYKLNDVVVTSSVSPVSFSNLSRTVHLITQNEIESSPANSLSELLQYSIGVDIRQRGVEGIQSDIGIRGGTFEQTLIMVNGIKIIDPQTGHHNLNLPFALNDVSRIEILKGPGSKTFGANAFSGAVNIITKKNYQNSLSVLLQFGTHRYFKHGLTGSYNISNFSNKISIYRSKSNGYIHNTDFDNIDFSYQSTLNIKLGSINLLFGYNDKEFGANSFYSSLFPNQWEHTTTKFLNLSSDLSFDQFSISPKAYWRRNDDEFLLDYTDPSFYQNIHQTDVYGFELSSSIHSLLGSTSFGGEYSKDIITSTNLGDHERERKGIFLEHLFSPFEKLNVNAGVFLNKYDKIDWKFWPGIDLSYQLNKELRFYTTYGKAFRIPTYTELYYSSPANIGNPDLESEEVANYELGFYFNRKNILLNAALFLKKGKNIIDWYRSNTEEPWQVRNIAEVTTTGFEFSFEYNLNELYINTFSVGYTYLNSDKETESFDSRYFLEHLRHQAVLKVNNKLPFNVNQSWNFRFEDRINYDDYFIIDTRLARVIDNFIASFSVNNLLDSKYIDISGVELPGRWIKVGLEYRLKSF